MSPLARTTGFAGLAAGVGIIAAAVVLPRTAHTPPVAVTTDTEAFCQQMSAKLQDLVRVAPRPPEAEVLTLGAEGRRLCQAGEVRGGILRLRRGLKLMMHELGQRGEP